MKKRRKKEGNEFVKVRSAVRISDLLFNEIADEVNKVFPRQFLWEDFNFIIGEAERKGETDLFLISPRVKNVTVEIPLYVEEVVGSVVRARMISPLGGVPVSQKEELLKKYLLKFGLDFSIYNGEILVEVRLPYTPVEVKYGCINGNGFKPKIFIHPTEVEALAEMLAVT